jgi:hypothetical protein
MNKKHLIYTILAMLLMASQPSFAMGQKLVFYGAKLLGAGTGIGLASKVVYEEYNDYINFNNKLSKTGNVGYSLRQEEREDLGINESDNSVSDNIEEFLRKKLGEVGVPNANNVYISSGDQWASIYDKALIVDKKEIDDLDFALRYRLPLSEAYKKALNKRSQLDDTKDVDKHINIVKKQMNEFDKSIGLVSMTASHEAKHMINEDSKKSAHIVLASACGIQALSSTISGAVNKIFSIQKPKTWPKVLLRSSGAIVSIVPKLVLLDLIDQKYHRYQEAGADEFACKKAQSIDELKAYSDFFVRAEDKLKRMVPVVPGESETERMNRLRSEYAFLDRGHPYPADRVKNVQKHIDQWKEEHNNTVEKN